MTVVLTLLAGAFIAFVGFCVGFGTGWRAGFAAVPAPERASEPPTQQVAAIEPSAEFLVTLDAFRRATLGPSGTRCQALELM